MHRLHIAALTALCSLTGGCSLLFGQSESPQAKEDGGIGGDGGIAEDGGDGGGGDGGLLFEPTVTLTNGDYYAINPSVIYDGSNYRVVWEDGSVGARSEVFASIVGSGITTQITTTGGTQPASLWTGSDELLIAWADGRNASSSEQPIYAGRYGPANELLGTEFIISLGLGDSHFAPSLASAGSQIGVTWSDLEDNPFVLFTSLNNAGVLGPAPATFEIRAKNSTIAHNGAHYGIAWHGTDDANIHFVRMKSDGTFDGNIRQLSTSDDGEMLPVVAARGSEFGVVWEPVSVDQPWLYFVSISPAGGVGAPVQIASVGTNPSLPAIAAGENGYGIAWQEARQGRIDIFFREFDSTGSPLSAELRLSEGLGNSKEVSLVYVGNNEYGAAWVKGPDGNEKVSFRRFSSR